jgi:DNA-binding MarR family transcriptional regulator
VTAVDVAPRWLTDTQQKVWRAYLLGSARLSERMDANLRQFGLDLPEYEILVALSETPGQRLRMSELAEAVHQSRSRLTHTVARMESDRLVERENCPTDRRGVWASLTSRGLSLLETAAPTHVELVRRSFVEVVPAADYEAVGRLFTAIIELDSAES